jgi:hypothetical protein
MALVPAPPNTFALITRPMSPDTTLQQWFVETVVAFDSEDRGAYVVGGLNRQPGGRLVRLDEIAKQDPDDEQFEFKLACVWEQHEGGIEAAREWAGRHIEAVHQDAMPYDSSDPRWRIRGVGS